MALPYHETSRPAPFWLPAGAFVVGCVAIAYGSMLGPPAGVAVALVGAGLMLALTVMSTWKISVDSELLRAGSHSVAIDRVVAVRAVGPEDARRIAGVDADARAVLRLRGGQAAVQVGLDDPACPYWLVSTRNPELLADAIQQAAQLSPSAHWEHDPPRSEE